MSFTLGIIGDLFLLRPSDINLLIPYICLVKYLDSKVSTVSGSRRFFLLLGKRAATASQHCSTARVFVTRFLLLKNFTVVYNKVSFKGKYGRGGDNYNKLLSLRETAGKCSSKERE